MQLDALRRHPVRTAFGLFLLGLLIVILLWDWNWLRGPVERIVQARTDREFDIGGDLDVGLGRVTSVRMDAVRFGNAPWSTQGDMATSDRVEFKFELFPALFRRDFRIPDLRLNRPRLRLELGPDGKGNWVFGEPGGRQPQFRSLWVDDGRLQYLDAKGKTDIDIAVASRPAGKAGGRPPIGVEGSGRWKGNPFTLEGTAESPLELRDREQPYRIDLRAAAGATRAHARGNLLDPLRFRDFDLKLALSGQNMEDLYRLIGVALPPTPPYSLDGTLTRAINSPSSSTWKYDGFSGTVGDSDIAGYAHVTTGKRVFFKGDFRSQRLDFDDLAGFVGAAPQAGGQENTNAELQALAAKQAASPRILPDTPYELDKLRAMDADVRLRATRLNAPSLPLDDMDAHLYLKDGVLRLEPLNFGVAGGDIRSTIRMNASESPIRTDADIKLRGLNLGKLIPDAKLTQDAIGKIGGDLNINGTGNSIAKMLGSANGDIAVGMGRGQISNLLMELAGLDIAEALKFMVTKDRKVPIRCAFGDFAVRDGIMDARAIAFDTTDTIIVGNGRISLRDETLDLRLRPRPKDRSLFAFRSPLLVGGTFKDPSFRPDMARVGLRGAIALTLGSIAPPAALLATLELGPGEDSTCGGRYAK
ncbi:AsmA family protein [Lysobacter sp. M2-1]|uniref:AsmA family protein n=1 Tax=Lysobacter sp. M2-1 TaxID=2916839 RepID=UPI001F59A5E7|nr:AsmA family protein [Lysobacter sp. M2-1]